MFQPDSGPLNEVNKVDGSAFVKEPCLPARPPVRQQRQQVEDADGAVAVEVGQGELESASPPIA